MTVKIDAMVGEIAQTFEYGNLFAREDVGGHTRLRVGLNEAQDALEFPGFSGQRLASGF